MPVLIALSARLTQIRLAPSTFNARPFCSSQGETESFDLLDHMSKLFAHIRHRIVTAIDRTVQSLMESGVV
jgi:hypothetical protein